MSRIHPPGAREVLAGAALLVAWLALWGEVSVANVLSGLVVVALARLPGIAGPADRGAIRIVPLLRFAWVVLVDLVVSTVAVAWEILTPTDSTEEAIVAVTLPSGARRHLLLLIVAITVTPGTAVVDADADRGVLYLHLLHCDRREALTTHVEQLAELACAALPSPAPAQEVVS